MEKKIIPAIIAKTQNELKDKIIRVKDHVDLIQLDVMDGKFVSNNSIDFDFKLPEVNCRFEAHLMIQKPEKWIKEHCSKVDTILAHFESCNNPRYIIDLVKDKGRKVGFVLNPETPIGAIEQYLDDIDQVLIMTVNPGFYGSPFLSEMLDKISSLRKLKQYLDIEVDGGITDKTIRLVDKAGANMFVSGSYIIKSSDVEKSIETLREIVGA